MAKNFQVVLDFLVNLKSDKSQVEKLAKEVENILGKVSPSIDFNSNEVKNGIKQLVEFLMDAEEGAKELEKVLSALDIDLDTEESKKALNEIESALKEINKTDLSELERTFNELENGKLDENILNLDKALKDMDGTKFDKEVEKIALSFIKAKQETEELIATQKVAQQALKLAGKEGSEAYQKIEKEIAEAEVQLKKMGATTEKTASLGDKFAKFGMITMGIEQVTSTLNQFQEPFIELDKQVRNIGTLGVKNFQEFANAATELSKKVPDSAGAIAQGVYDAISAGTIKVKDGVADISEGMIFVETSSKLATAGLTSTQDSINGLTSVMNAYGIEAGKAGQVADIFFGAVNVGKTTIPELNASLSNVIPTASAFGVEFIQVAAAIATMTKQGTPTAQATTQIRAALTELAKPGSTLAPIMQKAGVSLESLRKEGLQESLKKIGTAIEGAGKSATQIFSSVESAGAVMLLSGKNAQMASDDYNAVANSIGSTDSAFAVASEGIGNKSKMMMNSIQAGFNNVMGSLGTVGQTALSTATQVAPLITSFAGLSNLIPEGAIGKVGELGKSLLTKLVPGLAGATAGQGVLNAVMMVNPYVLAIAGIAALVTGLHFLNDALHETAIEKLDDAKADNELLKSKIEVNRQQRELTQSNIDLVGSFRKQGESAMQNEALLLKLASAYPGVIDLSKSYAQNLSALEQASKKNVDSLGKLNKEMLDLANQSIKLDIKLANLEVDTAKEEIENQLTDAFGNWATSVDEWVLGTSAPRQFAESIIQKYTKGIYGAKDDASLQRANLDFQMAVFNDKNFEGLDNKQKQQIIKTIQQMTSAKKKAIEEQNRSLEKDLADFKTAGFKENEIVDLLSKKYGKSKDEISAIIKKQEESKKETEKQVSAVDKLAEAWSTATAEVEKNIKSQLGAANEIYKKLQDKSITKEQRTELQEQYSEAIVNLRQQAKEKKNLDKIDELNQIRAGLKTKEGKSAFELARQEAELKNKSLEIEQKNYEYVLKGGILNEERKKDDYDELLINQKQLETIRSQRIAWIEALKAKKLTKEITPEGEIIFHPKVKETDKTEIKSIIQDFNFKIQDEQSKTLELKVKLKADDVALKDKLKELEQRKIEWEISIGIKEETTLETFVNEYKNKLSSTRTEIESSNAKIVSLSKQMVDELAGVSSDNAEEEKERIRIRYDLRIKETKEKNFELQQTEFETLQKVKDIEDKIYKSRVDSIKKYEEEKLKEIEDKYSKEEEQLKKFNEVWFSGMQKRNDSDKNDAIQKISDDEKKKLAELEKWQEMGTISKEEYENKKTKIEDDARKEREKKEEEFRKKQLRIDAQKQGVEAEQQRKKDSDILKIQKQGIEKQLRLLEEKAKKFDAQGKPIFDSKEDQEAYKNLSKQLDDTDKMIKEKGDILGTTTKDLQATVTESLNNLFAGDPDAAADSWRKFFGKLAGMLQTKASAFILDLILSPGTMEYLSALPFPANIIAVPVISAVVYSGVKAITDPIISAILSFSTGGRVDQPTMALIGDASRLGGRNREWIFNDSQLQATVQMASVGSNAMLIAKLDRVEKLLASQELKTTLKGSDIDIALRRNQYNNSIRSK
ncbi:MAG: hypothetical protein HW421_1197 [Ignavibacteria bacterium]|nr:hypothetical protein [Ignavibacteria bacterium]